MPSASSARNDNLQLIFVLAIASSFAPLSLDFFAPFMPGATRDLRTSTDALRSTIYAFLVGYGVSPFLWGALADRFGRHRVMLAGITVYGLASLGCFLSPGIVGMSLLRILQGIGAASGVVVARAVLRDIHGPAGTTKAISGMFLIMVWVQIMAPVMGGFFASHFSWRTSFLIMALIAGMSLAGSWLWQTETRPADMPGHEQMNRAWLGVLTNAVFMRNALPNMFCLTTLLIFLSTYSYLSEQHYGLSSAHNGYVLAIFNTAVSVGVYLVRLIAPRIGVEKTINLGLWVALTGWTALWVICLKTAPGPAAILSPILVACLGTGVVVTLTVGQALVPFSYAAGTASALFVCVQTAGAALLGFLATLGTDSSLAAITTILLICSLLAMISMKFIKTK